LLPPKGSDNLSSEIVDFEWCAENTPPLYVAVVQVDGVEDDDEDGHEPVGIPELPKMVIAAESDQPDWALLDYEDGEFDAPGDEEAAEIGRIEVGAEEDEEDDILPALPVPAPPAVSDPEPMNEYRMPARRRSPRTKKLTA
jgi:hypothetical protein